MSTWAFFFFFRKNVSKHICWGCLWDFSQMRTRRVFIEETCSMRSVAPLCILLFCFVILDDNCIECWHQVLWSLFTYSFLFFIWNIFVPHLATYSYMVLKCWEQRQLYSWTTSMQECINNYLTFKYLVIIQQVKGIDVTSFNAHTDLLLDFITYNH